jgi:hypothetical protein
MTKTRPQQYVAVRTGDFVVWRHDVLRYQLSQGRRRGDGGQESFAARIAHIHRAPTTALPGAGFAAAEVFHCPMTMKRA